MACYFVIIHCGILFFEAQFAAISGKAVSSNSILAYFFDFLSCFFKNIDKITLKKFRQDRSLDGCYQEFQK